MFEILIIDRNKNKNHNWDYQSIIHHPFYMESTWNPLISRPLRVPPQQISSISADGETLGRIRPRYSSCWFVTRMTSNKPHIYIYTTCIYMYACMHACMHGWMDGWMDELVYWGSLQSITNIAMNQLVLSGDRLSTQHCSEQLLGEVPLLPVGSFNFTNRFCCESI